LDEIAFCEAFLERIQITCLEQCSIVIVMYGFLFGQPVNKRRFHLRHSENWFRLSSSGRHLCDGRTLHETVHDDSLFFRGHRRHPFHQMKNNLFDKSGIRERQILSIGCQIG
jgi:hypothetical protein